VPRIFCVAAKHAKQISATCHALSTHTALITCTTDAFCAVALSKHAPPTHDTALDGDSPPPVTAWAWLPRELDELVQAAQPRISTNGLPHGLLCNDSAMSQSHAAHAALQSAALEGATLEEVANALPLRPELVRPPPGLAQPTEWKADRAALQAFAAAWPPLQHSQSGALLSSDGLRSALPAFPSAVERAAAAASCAPVVTGGVSATAASCLPVVTGSVHAAVASYAPLVTGGVSAAAASCVPMVAGGASPAAASCAPVVTGGVSAAAASCVPVVTGGVSAAAASCVPVVTGGVSAAAASCVPVVTGGVSAAAASCVPMVAGGASPAAASCAPVVTGSVGVVAASCAPMETGSMGEGPSAGGGVGRVPKQTGEAATAQWRAAFGAHAMDGESVGQQMCEPAPDASNNSGQGKGNELDCAAGTEAAKAASSALERKHYDSSAVVLRVPALDTEGLESAGQGGTPGHQLPDPRSPFGKHELHGEDTVRSPPMYTIGDAGVRSLLLSPLSGNRKVQPVCGKKVASRYRGRL
jgi:hypothetical protein